MCYGNGGQPCDFTVACTGLGRRRGHPLLLSVPGAGKVRAHPAQALPIVIGLVWASADSGADAPCPCFLSTGAVCLLAVQRGLALGAGPGALEPGAAALIHAKEGAQVRPVYL